MLIKRTSWFVGLKGLKPLTEGFLARFGTKSLFLILVLTIVASSQTARRPALPANLSTFVGQYPEKLMKVPSVRTRLRTLLGKSYSDFATSISVHAEMTTDGNFLFASGCMAHLCTMNEAAFAIDLKNKRIHAVIYEQNAAPRFFNEDRAATPQVLLDWVSEFGGTKNK